MATYILPPDIEFNYDEENLQRIVDSRTYSRNLYEDHKKGCENFKMSEACRAGFAPLYISYGNREGFWLI